MQGLWRCGSGNLFTIVFSWLKNINCASLSQRIMLNLRIPTIQPGSTHAIKNLLLLPIKRKQVYIALILRSVFYQSVLIFCCYVLYLISFLLNNFSFYWYHNPSWFLISDAVFPQKRCLFFGFNKILILQVDALVEQCGAPFEIKQMVAELWAAYLSRNGVATKKKPGEPKSSRWK